MTLAQPRGWWGPVVGGVHVSECQDPIQRDVIQCFMDVASHLAPRREVPVPVHGSDPAPRDHRWRVSNCHGRRRHLVSRIRHSSQLQAARCRERTVCDAQAMQLRTHLFVLFFGGVGRISVIGIIVSGEQGGFGDGW